MWDCEYSIPEQPILSHVYILQGFPLHANYILEKFNCLFITTLFKRKIAKKDKIDLLDIL